MVAQLLGELVPPGSRVQPPRHRCVRRRSASAAMCVDLPAPSMPSKVMKAAHGDVGPEGLLTLWEARAAARLALRAPRFAARNERATTPCQPAAPVISANSRQRRCTVCPGAKHGLRRGPLLRLFAESREPSHSVNNRLAAALVLVDHARLCSASVSLNSLVPLPRETKSPDASGRTAARSGAAPGIAIGVGGSQGVIGVEGRIGLQVALCAGCRRRPRRGRRSRWGRSAAARRRAGGW